MSETFLSQIDAHAFSPKDTTCGFKTVSIKVTHHGDMVNSKQEEQIYTGPPLPETIQCPNPRCQQGGYRIETIISEIARMKTTLDKKNFPCNGHEGTPKGRKQGAPCENSIDIEITATYPE